MNPKNDDTRLKGINQEFKEKEVQEKATKLGIPYINLLEFKVNPDVLSLVDEDRSLEADLVVFFQIGKKVRVAVSDPENIHAKNIIEQLKAEHFSVNINYASEESIKAVQQFYKSSLYKKEENEEIKVEKEEVIATEALREFEEKTEKNISKEKSSDALGKFHALAIQMHASDIHFQREEENAQVRFRIDGMLQTVSTIDLQTFEGILKQIKFNAHLKLNITNEAQDGQYKFTLNEREIDIRVSTVPSIYGESIVLRILDAKKGIAPLSKLGFKTYALEKIAKTLTKTEGMILLCGPTGSGKTTTMYSLLDVLNRPYRKIITLEDPVEYRLKGITQCEVTRKDAEGNFSFEQGLIAALRQDPDVVMVGEIREPKVASTAIQAAMTGHLVLSTLHTNSAVESITRLLNLQVPEYLLGPALNTIISQRLLRRICSHCKSERDWSDEALKEIAPFVESLKKQGVKVPKLNKKEVYGKGCDHCNHSGHLGRVTVSELLIVSPAIQELVQKGSDSKKILNKAVSEGFVTIKEDAILKVIEEETTLEEVLRVLG